MSKRRLARTAEGCERFVQHYPDDSATPALRDLQATALRGAR